MVKISEIKIHELKQDERNLNRGTEEGREMALADNATAHVNLQWDMDEMQAVAADFDITPEDWGVEMLGEEEKSEMPVYGNLSERFIVPPFSVLDATSGRWREIHSGGVFRTHTLYVKERGRGCER